ncbi:uncharacterized protein BX663DRAFT_428717, partial [Cokeromyces recurvatus]|uniref:uncharacterized protein n=1 Tax=Cokeromyces recurvatus TaxID=90255 RepID=UPI002220CA17
MIDVNISSGDTERERQFIRMGKYIRQLKRLIKKGGQLVEADDLPSYINLFGHHVEMAMRHWYRSILPKEFQLSLPLFEDPGDDLHFFTILEKECDNLPIALLTTTVLYNEYLVMTKSYVPKDPIETKTSTEELIRQF